MAKIGVGLIDCDLDTPYPTFHSTGDIKDKNKMLQKLRGFDYAFLIGKGIKIKDPLMFEHYAITSEKTGHQALLSASSELGNEKPLYDRDPYVDYWQYPGTLLMMLTKKAMSEDFDENFKPGTLDETEYVWRLSLKGMAPPFGLFVGVKGERFLFDIDTEVLKERSALAAEKKKKLEEATKYWQSKDPENFPSYGNERIINEKKIELKKAEGMI